MQSDESIIRLTRENIIELILENRNELIKKLLNDSKLREYLATRHEISAISAVKIEFIKRSLKELLNSPLDLTHYASLILEMQRTSTEKISGREDRIYYQDIEQAIKNYLL